VDDQIGRPTFAGHLASAVLKAADALVNDPELETNILHVTGGGEEASWADFAVEIFRAVEANVEVERIPSDDYPTIAERPLWSVLDSSAFERHFRHPMPDWRVGMNAALSEWQEARAND